MPANPKKQEVDPDDPADFDPLTALQPELDRAERKRLKRAAYMKEYHRKRNTGRPPGRPPKPKQPAQPKNYNAVWAPQYREDGTPGPQFALLSCPFPEIFFGGARGGGKSLPLTEMVVTPTGYRAMGELKVGDQVHGPGGSVINVIGVYPQGSEDVFQVSLVDGRTVRASRGHLWLARVGGEDMVITTDYIRRLMESRLEVALPVENLDTWVAIKSILYDGLAYTQCIKVDSPDGLFVVNDDIITHNTDGAIGKWLQHAALYGEDAKGVFFRRRFKQLEEVQSRCSALFPPLGATYHKGDAVWVFPNKAVLKLRHLWDVAATEEYQGHSYCVAEGTLVLMADGSYRPIETIQVDDLVMTLEGPKPVTATMAPGLKPCVLAEVHDALGKKLGEQIHPLNHPLLTSVSTLSQSSADGNSYNEQLLPPPSHWQSYATLLSQSLASHEICVDQAGDRSGYREFDRKLREDLPLPELSCQIVLLPPAHLSKAGFPQTARQSRSSDIFCGWLGEIYRVGREMRKDLRQRLERLQLQLGHGMQTAFHSGDGGPCVQSVSRIIPGSLPSYFDGFRLYGGPSQISKECDQVSFPSQDDAEAPVLFSNQMDGTDYTHEYNHREPSEYIHPYTRERRRVVVPTELGSVRLKPCGSHLVYDLTVKDANHYITETGLVNKNSFLVFEEVTNWSTPEPIDRMRGVLRSAKGAPVQLILTGNPGGSGHCVPYGEVLTPTGWKNIQDFKVGDPVMTVTPRGEIVQSEANQVHKSHHTGLMAAISQNGVTMVCTPNHKIGIVNSSRSRISLKPFNELGSGFTIPRVLSRQGKESRLDESGRAELHITADAVKMLDFDGEVYCIGVPRTHSFIIRQNGFVWVSGNSWVKARYISPAPQGWTPIQDDETGAMRIYIPSRLEDNTAMMKNDPTYAARLRGTGSAALVNAWLKGDWDIVAGGFFDDLILPDVHFLSPFHIPPGWGYRRSFDWGSASPASLGIWAVSDGNPVPDLDGFTFPRGSLIRIKEWYTVAKTKNGDIVPNEGLRLTNLALGEGIAHRSVGYRFSGCVADPSIYNKLGRESIYEEIKSGARDAGHNLIMSPADNNRIGGWQKVRDMLENARADRPEKPGLWVFETCNHWLRTVPVIQRSDTDFDDVDTTAEDHCLHGDTLVDTRDGHIRIRDLVGKVGEARQANGQYMVFWDCRRTRKKTGTITITTRDGRSVTCTPEHMVLTENRGWIEAENSLGDRLVCGPTTLRPSEIDTEVVSVVDAGQHDVFNLEVEHTHAFSVNNGLIVHNCADDTRYVCMTGARQLKVGTLVGR